MPTPLDKFAYQREYQISALSDPQVIKILHGMVNETARRRNFRNRKPNKQVFINSLLLALDTLGAKVTAHLFDLGAERLELALDASDPVMTRSENMPDTLKEAMNKAVEHPDPERDFSTVPLRSAKRQSTKRRSDDRPESGDVAGMNCHSETTRAASATKQLKLPEWRPECLVGGFVAFVDQGRP